MRPWAWSVARTVVAGWAAITLDFLLPRWLPGDPAVRLVARMGGRADPAQIEAARAAFGLDDGPLWDQYLSFLSRLTRGDLGVSVARFPQPVTEVIAGALPWTVALAGTATLIAFAVGSALGVVAARHRGGVADRLVPAMIFLGAFPYFWLAMALLWVFAIRLGVLPARHAWDPSVSPGWNIPFLASAVRHALLPAATLVLAGLGGWTLGMRNAVTALLHEPYVAFARSRGLPERRITWVYLARLALVPQATALGLSLGFVTSGALLTEMVFAWPGMGMVMLEAVRAQDPMLLQGVFLVITLSVLGAGLGVDLVVRRLDPRG